MEAVNVQLARLWLKQLLRELDPTWTVTLRTIPDLKATHTVQIGHAPPTPESFGSGRVDIPVAWWVNEGNSRAAVGKLYADLAYSSAGSSLADRIRAAAGVRNFTITSIGAQAEGPTGWLRAVSVVHIQLSAVPPAELPDSTDDDEES